MTTNKFQRKEVRKAVQKIKSKMGCERCGNKDFRVLQFDHKNQKNKKEDISRMVSNGNTLPTVLKEIKKCRVLCANCHSIRTHNQRFTNKRYLERKVKGNLIEVETPKQELTMISYVFKKKNESEWIKEVFETKFNVKYDQGLLEGFHEDLKES